MMPNSVKHREKLEKLKRLPESKLHIGPDFKACFTGQDFMIGKGCGGTAVYVGLYKDGSEIAVKRLLINDPERLSRYTEKDILNSLQVKSCANIVNYRGFTYEEPFAYLILDLCEETLEDYVKAHDEEHLLRHGPVIIREMLTGLCALHDGEKKILHLDLKPSNILVDCEGHMRLADFGISRILNKDQTTVETGPMGTIGWKAVESLGQDNITPKYKRKSDIQVMGMISFYVLTKGFHPFGEGFSRAINIINGNPVLLEKLSDPLAREFIASMISHNINDRPYAKEALNHQYLQTNAVSTDPKLQSDEELENEQNQETPAAQQSNVSSDEKGEDGASSSGSISKNCTTDFESSSGVVNESLLGLRKKMELLSSNDPMVCVGENSGEVNSQNSEICEYSKEDSIISTKLRESLKEFNFKENNYILIANKVPTEHRGSTNLAFLSSIPWMVVFDLFDPNSRKDGLHYILNETNDLPRATVKELEDFKDVQPGDDQLVRGTTWILRSQSMHESEWIISSKFPVQNALSIFKKSCPTGNIHLVFYALSSESFQEIADIIESSFSMIGTRASKDITIISEKSEIIDQIVRWSKQSIRKMVAACSISGCSLRLLKENMKAILGPINVHEPGAMTELAYCNGESKPVLSKEINLLNDLEVYSSQPSLSYSEADAERAREAFYRGGVINQLNLLRNHDIPRTLAERLSSHIDECLECLSQPSEDSCDVEIVTLRYESGSGATTLCRRILWDKKQVYRCAVVKTITHDVTDHQIEVLHNMLFEEDLSCAPPVLVLVDNVADQDLSYLQDKISERNVKCVLLNAVPIAKSSEGVNNHGNNHRDYELRQLDKNEVKRVEKLVRSISKDSGRQHAAKQALEREKRFIWLGLELFGRKYTAIEKRLSNHIEQVVFQNPVNECEDTYRMILYFCCLLDYYSKGRSALPHPCATDLLLRVRAWDTGNISHIEKLHDKFGGLLLETFNESSSSYGWRPAHSLVGEVVREKMDLLAVAKDLLVKMNDGHSYAKKYLIEDVVAVCLDRERKLDPSSNRDLVDLETSVDHDISGTVEIRTRFSILLQDIMNFQPGKVARALDFLITLLENVKTNQHKARSCQQIARLIAYECGMMDISEEHPQIARIYELLGLSLPSKLPTKGFEIAHVVIDEAINIQVSNLHHLVTKGAIFKAELNELGKKSDGSGESATMLKKGITVCKDGIAVFDNAISKSSQDFYNGYLHSMVGKIQTIICLLENFKRLPYFEEHRLGPDESFKQYMNDVIHPGELETVLDQSELAFILSLREIALDLLNELFEEIKLRRTRSYKHREIKELKNADNRALKLRTGFYQVTKLNRANVHVTGPRHNEEGIVNDILSERKETPFSSWKALSSSDVDHIHLLLSRSILNGKFSNIGMFMRAKAALQLSNKPTIIELSEQVTLWYENFPKSVWANLFNYMVHFPIPNGSLKTDVAVAKESIAFCNSHASKGTRRSGAEYLLGKGKGTDAIIRPYDLSENRQDLNKTTFWKSSVVFEKLERLRGRKTAKGMLKYRNIEIFFDNERYPKDSRDDLYFCLGFTVNGPYAYDPIDECEYQRLSEQSSKSQDFVTTSGYQPLKHAPFSGDTTAKARVWNVKQPKSAYMNSVSSPPANEEKPFPIASASHMKYSAFPAQEAKLYSSSRHPKCDASSVRESHDYVPNLTVCIRVEGGLQKAFRPIGVDRQGRVYHGAVVMGTLKSAECIKHRSGEFPSDCDYAHSWAGDTLQHVCTKCSDGGKSKCEQKREHEKFIYNLGPYMNRHGHKWKSSWKISAT